MNTTAHTVSPEDLMAFLDGELSASAAEAVAAHLAECEECAGTVAEFRSTSQALSRWTVLDGLPDDREIALQELARDAAYRFRTARREPFFRKTGSWKGWAVAAGFAIGAVIVVRTLFFAPFYSNRMLRAEYGPPPAPVQLQATQSNGGSKARQEAMASLSELDSAAGASIPPYASELMLKVPNAPFADLDAKRKSVNLNASSGAPVAPMIARTVNLTIVVRNFAASRATLDQILERHHGHFAHLEVNTQDDGPRNMTASLRIPAGELASALSEIRGICRVWNETQSGDEVTQQHQDLILRLQNSRETEARLQAILGQRTGKLADVLAVEQEIARVRGEIEQMEAEQKTLEHRVDFATVELRLSEEYKAQITVPDNSTSTRLHNALVAGYRNASGTVLGFVLFFEEYGPPVLIWLMVLALPVIVWRRYRRLRSKL
jgi:hypothetical protein